MKKNLLHVLLVLIAMQSTMAVADLHQAHQTQQEHVSFNHTEDISEHSIVNSPENQSDVTVAYDCHHCCHCHGVACHYLVKEESSFVLFHNNDVLFESFNLYSTRIISPNLRPPIV